MIREKNILSEGKHELIVGIPMVLRLRPIVIQPKLVVLITLDIEHVRIAIRISFCVLYHLFQCRSKNEIGCILRVILNQPT